MIAIRKKPGERPEIVEIECELSALQQEVGGYIQAVPLTSDCSIICDDEGRLKGYAPNCAIAGIDFVGTILVVGVEDEDFADIRDPKMVIELLFGKSDHPKEILLHQQEDGTWAEYKVYASIDCPTKGDYDRLLELVEQGKRMQWHAADVDFPTDEMLLGNNEFLVMIKGAANPTTLLFEEIPGEWVDEDGNAYIVEWWMPLPEAPKEAQHEDPR